MNLKFWQKKKRIPLPDRFWQVVFTQEATAEGVFDDYNKVIQIIDRGKIVREEDYSEIALKSIIEIYQLPGWDFTREKDSDFNFESVSTFGEVLESR